MGIVIITIPGEVKRKFVNELHTKTGGSVDLVVIQKRKEISLLTRFERIYKAFGIIGFFKECYYASLLRIRGDVTEALEIFRANKVSIEKGDYIPKTLVVDSINSKEVEQKLKELSPDLVVVWGTGILEPHILNKAKKMINLHFGVAPYYRGAVANQFAFYAGDMKKIGATIHYLEEKVDAGDILASIYADTTKKSKELFYDLNERAYVAYLDIAVKLFNKEALPATKQDITLGKNFLLRDWTHEVRYKLGKKILQILKTENE